jgi:hypothetical protein
MKREFSRRKKPKTSSHKAQCPQAADSFHGCCNRFCAVVADLVVVLHSTRQRSRTTIKKETKIQQKKTTQNFISQARAPSSCCFLPRLLQSILRRRRRFGSFAAQHTSALTHHDKKRNEKSAGENNPKLHLTRYSICKLLFPSSAAAIDFAPSSPIWLSLCTAHVSAGAESSKQHAENTQQKQNRKKYYKVQCLHSADLARFHPRGEQSEVRSWNTTAARINPLGVDVEFLAAQLHLRHGMVYAAADAGPE